MVKLSAEVDLPGSEAEAFCRELRLLCSQWPQWKLLSVSKLPPDPACPACGLPMVWDRDFSGYVCHHSE